MRTVTAWSRALARRQATRSGKTIRDRVLLAVMLLVAAC